MKFRSPLSQAMGLGSAKHGFSHWWWQRVTAIALIPMGLWFVISVLCLAGGTHAQAHEWLSSPINATIVLLFTLTALFHAQTGLQVVIEDYDITIKNIDESLEEWADYARTRNNDSDED